MKTQSLLIFLLALSGVFMACSETDRNSRGVEYMADLDMYYGASVKPYTPSIIDSGATSAFAPPANTVPRGEYLPYDTPNTTEGYEASASNKSPLESNDEHLAQGKIQYERFCIHCHGEQGNGRGSIVELGLYGGVPDYKSEALIDLPEGKIFHVITYGKNAMGPHGSQITPEERWQIVQYVQKLQKQN